MIADLFLGDSLAVGTAPYVHVRHMKVDARVGRPLAEGLGRLKLYGHQDRLLVSLGSNDYPLPASEIRRAISYTLHRARCVVWGTLHVRQQNYTRANHIIRTWSSPRVQVADWALTVRRHPDLLGPDQVHPTAHGYHVRSRLYVSALHRCPG